MTYVWGNITALILTIKADVTTSRSPVFAFQLKRKVTSVSSSGETELKAKTLAVDSRKLNLLIYICQKPFFSI
jgi:hypothetical protein